MKNLRLLLAIILTAIFVQTSFSQQRMNGKVVDINDGKTVVIQLNDGKKITAELEYIEIPEPEQQLSQSVKEHLKSLLLGKDVEFTARVILSTRLIGNIYLGEVNISQQMLRDGAAWYAIAEKDRQNKVESQNYQIVESQAKLEKRGVWGVENLKTAWEFRTEKEELKKQKLAQASFEKEKEVVEVPKPKQPEVKKLFPGWIQNAAQKYDSTNKIGNLMVGYNSQDKIGFVTTPQFKIEIADQKDSQKVNISVTYFYKDSEKKGKESYYLVAVESDSSDWKFLKTDDLLVSADGQKINVGKAQRLTQNPAVLTYKIRRNIVDKVAYADKVEFKVGSYAGKLDKDLQSLIKTLLNAAQ